MFKFHTYVLKTAENKTKLKWTELKAAVTEEKKCCIKYNRKRRLCL